MNTTLLISIVFVMVILYVMFNKYQQAATEREIISSKSREIEAISKIYQTKIEGQIMKQQGKATAKDWLNTSGSLFNAVGSIFSGVNLGLGGK